MGNINRTKVPVGRAAVLIKKIRTAEQGLKITRLWEQIGITARTGQAILKRRQETINWEVYRRIAERAGYYVVQDLETGEGYLLPHNIKSWTGEHEGQYLRSVKKGSIEETIAVPLIRELRGK